MRSLFAVLAPGTLFLAGLAVLSKDPRFLWLSDVGSYPWELWLIGVAGTAGTLGGVLDWRYHRTSVLVGAPERRAHFLALSAGGGSVFVLLALASVRDPLPFLVPVIAAALFTTALIAYDELVFHRRRRCGAYETVLHRTLVFGNGAAFLAWVHWCFVRSAGA